MKKHLFGSLVTVLILGAALPTVADDRWSLEKAVPEGPFLYVHSTRNPENEFLDKYWGQVFDALKKSGIDRDIKAMILGAMPEAEREQFQAMWKQATELCGAVDWGQLVGNEFVYVQSIPLPTPTHTFLFRMDSAAADKNVAGMRNILDTVAAMVSDGSESESKLTESEYAGAKVWAFESCGESPILIGQRSDVVVVSIQAGGVKIDDELVSSDSQSADTIFQQTLKLLNGDRSVKRLIDQPNYRKAMQALPEPENERFFCDMNGLFTGLSEGMGCIEKVIPESKAAEAAPWLRAVRRGFDHLRFMDCFASVGTTDGLSTHEYSVALFTPDAESRPLYRAFSATPAIKRFDRFIPKEAVSFSVTSGVDLSAVYKTVLTYINEDIPGGQDALTQWADLQTQMNFNVETDLLSWLGSECISVTMPPATPSPFGGSDSVLLMQVKDKEKAQETIERGMALLTGMLNDANQPLTFQPATSPLLEGFTSVTHPMVMMFLRPVYGFADGYLIIGSSEKAIERCLMTAKGEHDSIRKNARFAKEGLIPEGAVGSVSFADKSQMGQEMAQALAMLGMFAGFMPADDEHAKAVRSVFSMLQKLAPVAAQINFYKSEACMGTLDGKIYRSERVTHYKEPPKLAVNESDTNNQGRIENEKEETTTVTRK